MFHWRGSLKAHAARDPFFRAALAVANQDAPEMGRHCLRCHVPAAFLNDHLTPPDGSAFDALDLDADQWIFRWLIAIAGRKNCRPLNVRTVVRATARKINRHHARVLQ